MEAEAEVKVEAEAEGVDTVRFATFSCAACPRLFASLEDGLL